VRAEVRHQPRALGPADPQYWHYLVEAKKLAYSDLQAKNADPMFANVPVKELLSKEHAASLCGRIDPNVASKPAVKGGTEGGTIYLTAADRWGNMVSLIHSVFSVYGSRATVAPYGFVLHNRGGGFSLDPASPNIVAPHKRPFHTIIAGFVMKNGAPLMTFGNMGGSVQPETHAQHMVNLIDLGMNMQMTTDAARFTHNQNSNVLSLEANLFNLVGGALKAKGHEVRSVTGGLGRRLSGHPVHARFRGCRSRSSISAPRRTTCRSTACIAADRITGRMGQRSAGDRFKAGLKACATSVTLTRYS
jgi:gamma-glutamyltranspeptidase/glutathione hydrolase